MDIILKNKKAIVGLAILLIAFYLYSMFSEPSVETMGENVAESNSTLVEIADELSGIQFRQEIFSNPGYKQLIDFSGALPQQTPGRSNPFEVIGRD